jgi:hypothetical protein
MIVDGVELLRMIRDGELKERNKNEMSNKRSNILF